MSLKRIQHFAFPLLALIALAGFAPEGVLADTSPPPGQDATHPLVMQQAASQVANAKVGVLRPYKAPPKLPAVGGAAGPQREVFGFALASSLVDPTLGYGTWDFSLLSTVAFFGVHVQDDGTFAPDSGLAVWNSSELSGLMATAHAHGTKVVLTIIEQDFSGGTPHMCAALQHAGTTIATTVNELKAKGADGVNVDYEGLNGSCGSSDPSAARHAFTSFAAELRLAMPAGSYLSVDTYASSAIDAVGFFDVRALAGQVDSFFVMAYDLEYSNYARAPLSCGGFCLGPTAPLTGYYYNDTTTAAQYMSAVPASKVILGVPYYGRKSCVTSPTPNQYPSGAVTADAYVDAVGEAGSPLVKPGSYSAQRDVHDTSGAERWDVWVNTSLNCIRELYWDDAYALGKKYDLVNRDNLRGVGIWNLNYGGGSPELWSALSTYFACPVSITLAATQTTTQFALSMSTGSCAVTSFDVQEFDASINQGWLQLGPVKASGGTGSLVLNGFVGRTYEIQVRAHATSGLVGTWAQANTTVAATATKSHPWSGLYILDGYGGVDSADSPPLQLSAYWQGWRIARAAGMQPGNTGGLVLDGWGGLHAFGSGVTSLKTTAYWSGWDIARDFAWLPSGTGGYVLDGYGGLHPFSVNGAALPPTIQGGPYWSGWDIARKVVIFSDGTGGYVLDGYGGVQPFGIGQAAPPKPSLTDYWPGWNIARGIALIPGTHSGYVLEGFGGVHPFTPAGQGMPPVFKSAAYWSGWDIARGIWLLPSSTLAQPAGYVLDGWGGMHGLGAVPPIASCPYWLGWDIAVGVSGG